MRILKNNSGFSLIEMVVVLTIIAIMAGFIMANYRGGERKNKLAMEAQEMATDIRTAQNNTLGAVEYGTSTPSGGWGIYINLKDSNTSYKLFANKNYNGGSNLSYNSGEAVKAKGGREMELEKNVKIASTSVGNKLDITFVPPDPKTILYDDSSSTSSEANIFLENKVGNVKKIKVNSFGLIEVVQ